jgi:hypothetical protein
LFVCLPAGPADLSGFTAGTGTPIAPGPLLAGLAETVAGDGAGLAKVSEDCLFAIMSGGRRMASWGTWLELAAMREIAVRHPAELTDRQKRAAAGSAGGGQAAPAGTDQETEARSAEAGQAGAARDGGQGTAHDGSVAADQGGAGDEGAGQGGAGQGGARLAATDGLGDFSEFVADEVAMELRLTWTGAADRMTYACALAGRLPVTFAALGAGLIDPVHAKIIHEQTDILSAADAAKADPVLAAAAQNKTYGELRAAAAKLVLKLDPDSHERRKQARRREAHVRPFREESGNAGMIARELPSDEVLASWQHVEQRALDLRAAGVPGSLRELRTKAYLDLLQERDSRLVAGPDPGPADGEAGNGGPQDGPGGSGGTGPGPDSPAGTGPGGLGCPAGQDSGPVLAALVNITVPLVTLLGRSGTPGEAAGFGLLDSGAARDLIAAAARSPHTRWCVTALRPDGTAAAHGCATGRHPAPPGPEPPGTASPRTANLGTTCDSSGGPDQRPPPETQVQDYLRSLRVRLTPIARGSCDHQQAEKAYQPSRKLRHLVIARSTRCSAP